MNDSNDDDGFENGIVEVIEDESEETKQLRSLAVKSGMKQIHVNEMLKILRRRLLPELPKSAKTFLGTNTAEYDIKEMYDSDGSMGEYVYFGIKKGISECINPNVHLKTTIFLQFNIDGISLNKSGEKEFWVISAKVFYRPDIYKPFAVAIYSGNSKPANVDDFLKEYIEEINQLQIRGITISEKHFNVRIHCFICDMPARAFIKCTKGHTGYYSCERCTIKGIRTDNVTQFPKINFRPRTDESFRTQNQRQHHMGISPILRIRQVLDMIFIFVLDFMHLFCLGIMKRLLQRWFVVAGRAKVGIRLKNEVSRRLLQIRKCVPCEFQRKPRSLKNLKKYKATEFRFFLLYCGPVLLRDILDVKRMKNFLLLHIACRILCNNKLLQEYQEHAKLYLQRFFLSLKCLYRKIQAMNMHCSIHAADDVIRSGCNFSEISAFPFENFIGKLTSLIRTPHRPLSQICRRLHELNKIDPPIPSSLPFRIQILKWNDTNILKVKYREYILTTEKPDNFVMLQNNTLLRIIRITRTPESIEIEGNPWKVKKSSFMYPTDSRKLYMWQLRSIPENTIIQCDLNDVKFKMVKLMFNLKVGGPVRVYTMPLLHH